MSTKYTKTTSGDLIFTNNEISALAFGKDIKHLSSQYAATNVKLHNVKIQLPQRLHGSFFRRRRTATSRITDQQHEEEKTCNCHVL